ncbi:MAG: hypothetical protein AAGG79_03365, partial [Pseudomonadota bacterium]
MTLDLNSLRNRLSNLRKELPNDPLANPVRRLSHEISKAIEAGETSLDDTEAMISALAQEAAARRAEAGTRYLCDAGTLAEAADAILADAKSAEDAQKLLSTPLETIVFTGHPTFAMAPDGGAALRGQGPLTAATSLRAAINLDDEHKEACCALTQASGAILAANRALLHTAFERFGDACRHIVPAPLGLAT